MLKYKNDCIISGELREELIFRITIESQFSENDNSLSFLFRICRELTSDVSKIALLLNILKIDCVSRKN